MASIGELLDRRDHALFDQVEGIRGSLARLWEAIAEIEDKLAELMS